MVLSPLLVVFQCLCVGDRRRSQKSFRVRRKWTFPDSISSEPIFPWPEPYVGNQAVNPQRPPAFNSFCVIHFIGMNGSNTGAVNLFNSDMNWNNDTRAGRLVDI